MIRILVTGSAGQLGQCLREIVHKYPEADFKFCDSTDLDITRQDKVDALLKESRFDYCINCAAYTDVEQAEKTPKRAFEVNAEGVKNLALACRDSGTALIHISTDYVFDGKKKDAYTVHDIPNPINEYGKSKLAGEEYIRNILEKYFIIRTSWLYSIYGNNFVKSILKLGIEKDEVHVVKDQTGSPTYAQDLADFILYLIANRNTEYGSYNYTNDGTLSWYEFAVEINSRFNNGLRIIPVSSKTNEIRIKRPKNSKLETTRTSDIFDIVIPNWKVSLDKCLKKLELTP